MCVPREKHIRHSPGNKMGKANMPTIYFYWKNVYGNKVAYFSKKSADHQRHYQNLTGLKTLTDGNMSALRQWGFTLEEVMPEFGNQEAKPGIIAR